MQRPLTDHERIGRLEFFLWLFFVINVGMSILSYWLR